MDVNLVLIKKDGAKKVFSLSKDMTIIGRRSDCDLRIPLMSISRKHCQLNCKDGKITVRDLDSRNGTDINDKSINEANAQSGDRLKIGPIEFLLQINGKPEIDTETKPLKEEQKTEVVKGEIDSQEHIDSTTEMAELDSMLEELGLSEDNEMTPLE
ncbi:MAG: FHA domain-containing protein [Planctomycetota bacterium]|jgi:pSer/pThr/pTyr-binding forkhead associated (FHA) protein